MLGKKLPREHRARRKAAEKEKAAKSSARKTAKTLRASSAAMVQEPPTAKTPLLSSNQQPMIMRGGTAAKPKPTSTAASHLPPMAPTASSDDHTDLSALESGEHTDHSNNASRKHTSASTGHGHHSHTPSAHAHKNESKCSEENAKEAVESYFHKLLHEGIFSSAAIGGEAAVLLNYTPAWSYFYVTSMLASPAFLSVTELLHEWLEEKATEWEEGKCKSFIEFVLDRSDDLLHKMGYLSGWFAGLVNFLPGEANFIGSIAQLPTALLAAFLFVPKWAKAGLASFVSASTILELLQTLIVKVILSKELREAFENFEAKSEEQEQVNPNDTGNFVNYLTLAKLVLATLIAVGIYQAKLKESKQPSPETLEKNEILAGASLGIAKIVALATEDSASPLAPPNLGWKIAVGTVSALPVLPVVHSMASKVSEGCAWIKAKCWGSSSSAAQLGDSLSRGIASAHRNNTESGNLQQQTQVVTVPTVSSEAPTPSV